jgi:Predicted membrane protein
MADNVAGMLAYVTFIPAIVFLAMAPYNRNSFIRFHAFQCIFFSVALFAIHLVLAFIPVIGWLISMLVSLAALGLWIVMLIKAYQGQRFKLPVIGDMAEKQANTM